MAIFKPRDIRDLKILINMIELMRNSQTSKWLKNHIAGVIR